jgi:glycosyltransferase involved in cell wall biosynthesis
MQNKLFFSIIIPTYNRASLIEKTIRSVLTQSYTHFEIIIVDDGSTDNTEELVKNINHPSITYYKIKNAERGAARNYGCSKATGKYITFLDSDDLVYSNYLSNAVESIEKYKSPPFLHLAYEIKNEKGRSLYKIDKLQSDDISIITKGNPLSCIGIFLRKDAAEKFRFNEDRELSGSEDWELWLRVIANYGIKTDNRISACLMHHNDRSVFQFDEKKLFTRKELALKYAFMDEAVIRHFGKNYKKIDSYADSYISLHLALSKNNKKSLKYLLQSFRNYPPSILSRRTIAIFKHLFLNKFNFSI